MKKIIVAILLVASLSAETMTLKKGWNLIGSSSKINVESLKAYGIQKVFVYVNNSWQSYENGGTNNIGTKIDKNKGFWVYSFADTSFNYVFNSSDSIDVNSIAGTYSFISAQRIELSGSSQYYNSSQLTGSTFIIGSNGTWSAKTFIDGVQKGYFNGTFVIQGIKMITHDETDDTDAILRLTMSGNNLTYTAKDSTYTETSILQKIQ